MPIRDEDGHRAMQAAGKAWKAIKTSGAKAWLPVDQVWGAKRSIQHGPAVTGQPSQPLSFLIDDWSRGLSKHLRLGAFLAGAAARCHHVPARPTLFATRPKSPLQPEAALWDVCNANLLRTRGDEAIAKPITAHRG